jgi:carotenoid cleavage dioxygenase-like enzyme
MISTTSPMYQKIMENDEPACLILHMKHNIIKEIYMNMYEFGQNELLNDSNIVLNKIVMVHKVVLIPNDIVTFIKSFLFRKGSRVQERLVRNEKIHKYKLNSLRIDLLDDLIIYQRIVWH